jgi:RimJ/RimL family protein N-acetyltransferase
MELVTARLRIDALHAGDAEALFACRGDPAVARFQGWRPLSVAAVRDFIAAQPDPAQALPDGWFQRAIRRRDDHTLIGDLGLCLPPAAGDSPQAAVEFGISLLPAQQGRGYAREVLQALFAQVFGVLGRRRIQASVDPRNTASMALLHALGMRQEAHHRQSLWLHGAWVDDAVFALLASEWRAGLPCADPLHAPSG